MRKPRFGLVLIQMIILTIPLEISKTWFPILLLEKSVGGQPVSVLEVSRLILALLVLVLIGNLLKNGIPLSVLRKELVVPLLLLGAYCVSWLFTPAPLTARNETIRLVVHLLMALSVIWFVRNPEDVQVLLGVFRWTTLVLGGLVVFQAFSGVFWWNEGLSEGGRYNATMGDPNILARYMVMGFFAWLLGPLDKIKGVRITGILLCLASIVLIQSRGAWVIFAGLLVTLWFFGPRYLRRRVLGALLLASVAVCVAIMFSPTIQERFATLSAGSGAADVRVSLAQAGIAMFLDHPAFGVGLGGYPIEYVVNYPQFLTYYGERGVLSHAALITTMAEFGIVGLAITAAFLAQCLRLFRRLQERANPLQGESIRQMATVVLVSLLAILLGSQAEGRFWEEPYLWVFWGMLVALSGQMERPLIERPLTVAGNVLDSRSQKIMKRAALHNR